MKMYDVITTIGMFKCNVLLFNNPNIDFSFRYTPCYIQGKRLWVISLWAPPLGQWLVNILLCCVRI